VRRRHSEEFKQNAVRRMLSSGKTASEVARELGLHPTQFNLYDTLLTDVEQESLGPVCSARSL
jgi:hypothetical protein